MLSKEAAAGLNVIHTTLDAGSDPRQFTRQLVEYLRSVLLVRMGNAEHVDTTNEVRHVMAQQAQAFEEAQLLRTIRLFNQVAVDAPYVLAAQPASGTRFSRDHLR